MGSSTMNPFISCVALDKSHKPQFPPLQNEGNNPCPAGLFKVDGIKSGRNGHSQRGAVTKYKFCNQDGYNDEPEPGKH